MKTKAPPPRTHEQPVVDLDRLRRYLEEKGYRGKTDEPEICVASVMEFNPANHHPYGKAMHRGQIVLFRSGHFHRVATIAADVTERFREPQAADLIWVMVGVHGDGKKVAIAWGFVDELPLGFATPTTCGARLLRWTDSAYRRLRNKSWRGIFRRAARTERNARS
jgi:hypothetical protein